MSKTKYRWWGYVRAAIRDYPDLCEAYQEALMPTVTASASGMPHGGEVARSVETAVLRAVSSQDGREFRAVRDALLATDMLPSGRDRLRLIRMVYWARSYTLQGAAMAIHVSYKTAYRWHRRFLLTVAKNLGLL